MRHPRRRWRRPLYLVRAYCVDEACRCDDRFPGVTLYAGPSLSRAEEAARGNPYAGYEVQIVCTRHTNPDARGIGY